MKRSVSIDVLVNTAACLAVGLFEGTTFAGEIWPQFRGPICSGVSELDRPPTEFGPGTNLLWRIELPPGWSSPVVWGDRIFVTAVREQKLETIGVRRSDGEILWRQAAPTEKFERTQLQGGPASATPATDGERVYAYFGSYGVLAYDFKGKEVWSKPLPVPNVEYGTGSSPALMEGRLIINRDQEEGISSLLALDGKTGTKRWESKRPEAGSSYTTPVLWKRGTVTEVVLAGTYRLMGYDLQDGREKWSARGLEASCVCPTPVLGADRVYGMSYSFGEGKMPSFAELAAQLDKNDDKKISRDEGTGFASGILDQLDKNKDNAIDEKEWQANVAMLMKGQHGVFAVRAPAERETGDLTETHVAWRQKRGAATVASPLFYDGQVYTVQDGGRVSCYDAQTGRPVFEQERLGAEGSYLPSPVAANRRIYFVSSNGVVSVIEAGEIFKVVARNDLKEKAGATPAIADNKLYVRTEGHLWAFGERK
jgi:outer membrane protein assembly factor BamB